MEGDTIAQEPPATIWTSVWTPRSHSSEPPVRQTCDWPLQTCFFEQHPSCLWAGGHLPATIWKAGLCAPLSSNSPSGAQLAVPGSWYSWSMGTRNSMHIWPQSPPISPPSPSVGTFSCWTPSCAVFIVEKKHCQLHTSITTVYT